MLPPAARRLRNVAMTENWYCEIVGMELGPMSFDDLVQLGDREKEELRQMLEAEQ